jgi:2-hydroxy-3-keto-5-methylthiopentenyl-1-phosphate phosphatase
MRLRVFCDFDGTVAQNDVGNLVFAKFGDPEHWWDLVDLWKQGKIGGRDLWSKQVAVSRMKPDELDKFATTQMLDPYFNDFIDFCHFNDIPVYVCSDGMDAYISRILDHHGLFDLTVCSNHLEMTDDGSLTVDFPYYEFGCGQCANCKGYHVKTKKQPGEKTVYIGDGMSDVCGAIEADIVFAKKDLLEYCREKRIDCIPFENFCDVKKGLEIMALKEK